MAHFVLDEAKQMLLVHAARVVHVSIDFTHIVKVTVRHALQRVNGQKALKREMARFLARVTLESASSWYSFNKIYICHTLSR